jgi:hypothetical protein
MGGWEAVDYCACVFSVCGRRVVEGPAKMVIVPA